MRIFLINLSILFIIINAGAQDISSDNMKKPWRAYWIYVPGTSLDGYGVYNFRKEFELIEQPGAFIVHVSGDNRYKLFVNGNLVSLGPARGDLNHWNYETVNIGPFLKKGKNTIASIVWNEGKEGALAQMSNRTGFILQGNTTEEGIINTNNSWKCIQDSSYAAIIPRVIGFYAASPGEFLDMRKMETGWMEAGFNDSSWKKAASIGTGVPKGANGLGAAAWMLVPSIIPQMELSPQRLNVIRMAKTIKLPVSFPASRSNIVIPANFKVSVLLDQAFLTNAYPTLLYSEGKDAAVSFTYAESLYDEKTMEKANRNEVDGKIILGVKDSIICNGLKDQVFTTLAWRTFRYIQVDIETKNSPLIIHDLYGVFTAYPFTLNAKLDADNPLLEKMLDIGWRTARLCAAETYMDCPYYERLQYVGDTRIQAMISYFNSGDTRLAKQAINAIDNSRLSEGITLCRYPTNQVQVISPFSLLWIGMLDDYLHYCKDRDFVRSHLPGMRQILSFFENYLNEDGTIQNSPYWNFIDWAENSKGWKNGVPPLNSDGGSAVIDLQLLWAYQWATELEEQVGLKLLGEEYHKKAERLQNAIIKKYWDSNKKMFADNDKKTAYSQHTNSLAILTETIKGEEAKELFRKLDQEPEIAKASIYFSYYVNQALNKVGFGNEYLSRLDIWKQNIGLGMSTWGEDSKVSGTRSDCHAWSASPNIEFYRIVLGIESDAPGFTKVRIEPHLGDLKRIDGVMPHPNGFIKTDYTLEKNGRWKISISLPTDVSGTFIWNGKSYFLRSGENTFQL